VLVSLGYTHQSNATLNCSCQGITGFSAESILRKIRLIALAALAARSSTKTLDYSTVAEALKIGENEVEAIAIDGELCWLTEGEY
jgi:hypothetical protein